ncbi:MvaI/BcnI family restriction endonuclease [Aliarcobacter butzleri]|uniref:MvaI/BcnI family restriction endonuclease n=1 Tax=Aliarcobacter butzleri TaxID=28197 RepID=UPI0021B2D1FA|nr:MvaI/BcnI family restriction endonuclease [Aliarcobacter butzleri]MCT7610171.1 MvaI/BcnI family restriction endonuclease [Aliarcobacter butzleri]
MIFIPTPHEQKYIDILDKYSHNEFIFIRMTETMHKKSIIDANKSLRLFLEDAFNLSYYNIEQGHKTFSNALILTQNGLENVKISHYRPETKKGDPRFWVYGIKKIVYPNDMFILTSLNNSPFIIPLKWSFENFNKLISDSLGSNEVIFSDIQNELISKLKKVYEKGWIKTLRAGDTGVGYTFETLIDIRANSSKEPDFKGIEIKTSRKNGNNNLQTLFSKTPEWGEYKNRAELVIDRGYWDENKNRYALYMTINALVPNSKGWILKIDYDAEKIYILQNNDKTVYYDFRILKNALETKHKETLFIKADVKNKTNAVDPNEEFFYNEAFLCVGSSFVSFLSLIEKGLVSLDFAIHHDPKTKKTRDHGFLWRMNSQYIPMLFKEHKNIL